MEIAGLTSAQADALGSVAAVLTTAAFLPQLFKTFRTRRVEDISLVMYLVFTLGVGLWLVYGLLLDAMPIIVANGITLGSASAILAMKVWYTLRPPGS